MPRHHARHRLNRGVGLPVFWVQNEGGFMAIRISIANQKGGCARRRRAGLSARIRVRSVRRHDLPSSRSRTRVWIGSRSNAWRKHTLSFQRTRLGESMEGMVMTHAGGAGVDCVRETYPNRVLSACRSAA